MENWDGKAMRGTVPCGMASSSTLARARKQSANGDESEKKTASPFLVVLAVRNRALLTLLDAVKQRTAPKISRAQAPHALAQPRPFVALSTRPHWGGEGEGPLSFLPLCFPLAGLSRHLPRPVEGKQKPVGCLCLSVCPPQPSALLSGKQGKEAEDN